ncbi:MAG: hypothetical protein AAF384_09070 [Pseudomonadota bacterium]
MNRHNFPFFALAIGACFALLVAIGMQESNGRTVLPLFTLLAICEFCFFVTAIGAAIKAKQLHETGTSPSQVLTVVALLLMSAGYVSTGIALWPA